MRLLCSVWIVAALATLVAGIDVGPKSLPTQLARNDNEVPIARLLRIIHTNEDEEDEERGGLDKFSGFVKAKVSKSTDKLRLQLRRAKTGSGEEFFSILKLDKMGVNLFDSPSKVKAWAKYMAVVHRKNPEEAMIVSLGARYSDDVLAKMLVEAKRMPKSAQIAGKLEAAQIQVWMKTHETVDDIFTLLKLDEAGGNLFRSPQFKTWTTFATTSAPKNPEIPMMMSLKTRYSDESLAGLIESATKVPSTEEIAIKLQTDMLNRWRLDRKSSDNILSLLKLNKGGDDIIGSPEFNTWAIYTSLINKKDPEVAMISTLTANYGDEALAKMLETAKQVRETKAMAKDLQNAQFNNWLEKDFTPTKVLNLLGMQHQLREPNAIVWYTYKAFYETAKAAKNKA